MLCKLDIKKAYDHSNWDFLLQAMQKWAAISGLRINLDKSEILPIGNLSLGARALLCKWSWRFMEEKEAFWKQVISKKFWVEEGGWYTREVREGFGVGLWKEIRKEGSLLSNNIVFSMGNGRRVRFWKDKWCGVEALCDSYLSLYALAASKETWIVEVQDSTVERGVGIFVSLGISMIGRWTWWNGSS
ncbi:hypothetical protein CK203_023934 [Vitis vinifera]|uniref:Uncharacterized protein n=1 Tax=Vitis vinifera TaxID=29760 RepID=A0A438JA78_VITVI|nr:hypothetical protein CK203_023934 [Vitis vinifera]